jgi:hypothetical protein
MNVKRYANEVLIYVCIYIYIYIYIYTYVYVYIYIRMYMYIYVCDVMEGGSWEVNIYEYISNIRILVSCLYSNRLLNIQPIFWISSQLYTSESIIYIYILRCIYIYTYIYAYQDLSIHLTIHISQYIYIYTHA